MFADEVREAIEEEMEAEEHKLYQIFKSKSWIEQWFISVFGLPLRYIDEIENEDWYSLVETFNPNKKYPKELNDNQNNQTKK